MKTSQFTINDLRLSPHEQADAACVLECGGSDAAFGPRSALRTPRSALAFTLIELLVVIAVIAVLAGLLIPVGGIVVRHAIIQRAQSERDQLETAIQVFYSKYGFYPPGNANTTAANLAPALKNQLYFELTGTTTNGLGDYVTLDNSCSISTNTMVNVFGVSAFINCTKGSGEDSHPAQPCLAGFLPGQIATMTNGNDTLRIVVTGANSDPTYQPLPGVYSLAGRPANPWRYMCPGTNNPNSYDLWVQLYVGGKTDLICNWQKNVQYNSPLP